MCHFFLTLRIRENTPQSFSLERFAISKYSYCGIWVKTKMPCKLNFNLQGIFIDI